MDMEARDSAIEEAAKALLTATEALLATYYGGCCFSGEPGDLENAADGLRRALEQ